MAENIHYILISQEEEQSYAKGDGSHMTLFLLESLRFEMKVSFFSFEEFSNQFPRVQTNL